ncbi:kinase-like domain-containing protein [Chaetomium tenue]|uniref:Kinase-like domain-containing protein n=1 Tax=Chaetomium tenue TaxID=1854479 RepID=A0ACB7PF02_9PEZI|nr:kinase-like domain-containing protein [Chaetomium globosum]
MSAGASNDDFLRVIQDDDSRYYQRGETLGKGSYGEVFKLMACKLQIVTTTNQDWSRKRELDVWRKACEGTNYVARVYDASINPRTKEIRIYTELLEGGDLYRLICSIETYKLPKRLHPAIVYLISLQLAWGLSEIQERGILHRDIKPDNALLTMKITPRMNLALWELRNTRRVSPDMESHMKAFLRLIFQKDDRLVVLTDFGLSRIEEDEVNRSAYSMAPGARWTVGTSAPELFFHNHQSPMADVYSIGVVMFSLCSFQGAPQGAAAFPRIPTIYSPNLQAVLDECLAWDPRERPSSHSVVNSLYELWVAERDWVLNCDWTKAFIAKHGSLRKAKADFDREQARKYMAEEAQHRDRAATKAREQEHARWTTVLERQKRRAAQDAQAQTQTPTPTRAASPTPTPTPTTPGSPTKPPRSATRKPHQQQQQ